MDQIDKKVYGHNWINNNLSLEKYKTFRGDGGFVSLVGMEDLCRKKSSQKD